jgi:hypothetical protein
LGEKKGKKEKEKETEKEDVLCRDSSSLLAHFASTRRKFAMGEVTIVSMPGR